MGIIGSVKSAGGKLAGVSTGMAAAGFGLGLAIGFSRFFKLSLTITAGFMQSMDPAYPFLQAIAMHAVSGKPFLYFMSESLKQGTDIIDGVNISEELLRFKETFQLINSTDDVVVSVGENSGNRVVLAVPPGGKLVMTYEWS
ncbi:MAG: hypothetical protein GOV01_03800 [Candidatus Altiarchaeota archaeon]|nr:hypothetical protein [Candidatus Altiarchaeota archaeon]